MQRTAFLALTLSLASPVVAGDFTLALPIGCALGKTCFIHNQVDRAPSLACWTISTASLAMDGQGHRLSTATLTDMAHGADVLATAPGGVRDGVTDIGPSDATQGKDDGNDVVRRHP